MFDEETEASLDELAGEFYEAHVEDQTIRFWEGSIIRSAPTGAPPEYITVEIEGIYDGSVMWRGVPATPAVGDEVLVWENPITHRREVWGGSGTTGTSGGSWCQKIIVAKCNGDFALLSAAIAWINALPAGQVPAAARLYAINMLGGNFAEAAPVTIPQYVHVGGEGEGTEIEMGANSLLMSDDSSLQDVVVESSDVSQAVLINNKDNVVLRNVHVIQTSVTGTPDGIYVSAGSTNVRFYDCFVEVPQDGVGVRLGGAAVLHTCIVVPTQAWSAGTYGFRIVGTPTVLMDYCTADHATNLADGLHLNNDALTCTTRWCTFRAYDDDVNTGAASTWQHFDCQFDPASSTIAGTETALTHGLTNFADGVEFTAATGLNIITVPDNVAQALNLVDVGGLEYMRIVSTNANPYLCLFPAGGGQVVVGGAVASATLDVVGNLEVSGYSGTGLVTSIAGTSTDTMAANQRAISIGATLQPSGAGPGVMEFVLDLSPQANIATAYGQINVIRLVNSAFNITAAFIGVFYRCDTTATYVGVLNSISTLYIANPLAGGSAPGIVAGLFIEAQTAGTVGNYAIYTAGTGIVHLHDRTSVGGTVAPLAQLHVDQSAAGGGIPVALFDQADLSEEFIEFKTTVGAGNPIDTAGVGGYYGKARVKVTGVAGYKYIALYN